MKTRLNRRPRLIDMQHQPNGVGHGCLAVSGQNTRRRSAESLGGFRYDRRRLDWWFLIIDADDMRMKRTHRNFLVTLCLTNLVWAANLVAAPPLPPLESIEAASRARWLIEGPVIDAKTGSSVEAFTVIPGSISTDDNGRATIRWRENLKREMKAGHLQWPRTSGFSVMRFKIIAEGYHPVVSPIIRRGGPHLRMRVKLRPMASDSKSDS